MFRRGPKTSPNSTLLFSAGFRVLGICRDVISNQSLVFMDSSLNSAEMQHFLEQEKQKAMLNEMVAKLTSVCWDKCITSTPGSKFGSGESSCLSSCAQRYMDMSMIIMKRFQSGMH